VSPLHDERVPLCFDTSALFYKQAVERFLRDLRTVFPHRDVLIPVTVVAETVRQLSAAKGAAFSDKPIRRFLAHPDLALEVVPLDVEVAVTAWRTVTDPIASTWRWEDLPRSTQRPCAERCRTGDYQIYAVARHRGALLVTDDRGLRAQVKRDGYQPGAVSRDALQSVVLGGLERLSAGA